MLSLLHSKTRNTMPHYSKSLKYYNFEDDDSATSVANLDASNDEHLTYSIKSGSTNLCIDGMSCSGKSSVIARLERDFNASTFKINKTLDCTDYNYNSTTAFQYLLKQIIEHGKLDRCIVDRSILSNVAFQLVYWLMSCEESVYEKLSPHALCAHYVQMHHMQALLEFIKAQNHNILIVVNSDIDKICNLMITRGVGGDVYKGRVTAYAKAQYDAYIFLANVLELPVFDHNKVPGCPFERLYQCASRVYTLVSGCGDTEDAMEDSSQSPPPPASTAQYKRSEPKLCEWADRLASFTINKR